MKNQLIEAMKDINSQIKKLDKELDCIVISELRRQRFFILSTYKYLLNFETSRGRIAVKSMPDFRIMEDSHAK